MIDVKELMAKVGKIRILTNRLIDDQLSGDYHSTFKGQGVEFDEVRPYVAGDDVRSIDWNVTARTGMPYIKRFSEERELTVLFLVDVSGSQSYGSTTRSKAELAAEVASLLALTAIRNQDKIGLVLFSDKIVKYIPPRKGRQSVMRLVVFLVSDFQCGSGDDASAYEKLLRVVARRHDVIAIPVSDPAENELPLAGLAELEDPETGELLLVDTADSKVRTAFAEAARKEVEERDRFFARNGIDNVPVATDRPYIQSVRALFKRRASKR